ncbi:MAG: pyroglutamyl-peptidase I [Xanthobacteraceae bacterium]|nr:pyroglutamyl-peptidase I [Xanthobacteraceae bacterium]
MTALRVLITGFGPFPGAPFNPTGPLVERLIRLRRPALSDVDLSGHIFRVSYGAVDRDLPALLAAHAPDAVLMFGLAQRTAYLRVEARARNAVTRLWPDADHATRRTIAPQGPAHLAFGPQTTQLLQAARATGITARLSQDAGRYLCNYLCWNAIAAAKRKAPTPVVAFIHVPLVGRPGVQRRAASRPPIGFEDLVDAGEALLMTMVKLARRRPEAPAG